MLAIGLPKAGGLCSLECYPQPFLTTVPECGLTPRNENASRRLFAFLSNDGISITKDEEHEQLQGIFVPSRIRDDRVAVRLPLSTSMDPKRTSRGTRSPSEHRT